MDPGRSKKNVEKASPPVKVVGFHVEGAAPSPGREVTLGEQPHGIKSNSPSPVIIPPSFQVGAASPSESRGPFVAGC